MFSGSVCIFDFTVIAVPGLYSLVYNNTIQILDLREKEKLFSAESLSILFVCLPFQPALLAGPGK